MSIGFYGDPILSILSGNDIQQLEYHKQIIAVDGRTIKFSYLGKSQSVVASILTQKSPSSSVNVVDLPSDLKLIKTDAAFFKYLGNVKVTISSLKPGEYKIDIVRITYQEALNHLREHLLALANPLLKREILEFLDTFINNPIPPDGFIIEFQEKLGVIPSQTDEVMNQFNNSIKDRFDRIADTFSSRALEQEIQADLKALTQNQNEAVQEVKELWEKALHEFLQLPAIWALNNDDMSTIMNEIEINPTNLRNVVDIALRNNNFDQTDAKKKEALNKQVEIGSKNGFEDLFSLLREIEGKPKIKDGIKTHWFRDEDYFLFKNLILKIPNQTRIFEGIIEQAVKQNRTWCFQLDTDTEVTISEISENYQVKVVERFHTLLEEVFFEKSINGEEFEIGAPEIEKRNPKFAPGHYRLENRSTQSTGNQDGKEWITELTIVNGESKYVLKAIHEGNSSNYISQITVDDDKALFPWDKYTIIKSTQHEHTIPCHEANDAIAVALGRDQKQQKTACVRVLSQIEAKLAEENNQEALNNLLENLKNIQLSHEDDHLARSLIPKSCIMHLDAIVKVFKEKLKEDCSFKDLVLVLINRANSLRLTYSVKDFARASSTMDLILKAEKELKEIRGKRLVLFVGNTGSGKSTAICYLLGAKLKIKDNLVELDESEKEKHLPKIGQSFVNSETVFVTGYPKPENEVTICDFPGFRDTRGAHFDLCTNYSIEKAITKASSISAIVLTVPFQSLKIDKGTHIVDLLASLRSRFPFEIEDHKSCPNIYILVTQAPDPNNSEFKEIVSGEFFDKRLRELADSSAEQKNKATWKFLKNLWADKRLEIIEIERKGRIKPLLQIYASNKGGTGSPIRQSEQPPQSENDHAVELCKVIELYSSYWKGWLKGYFEELPSKINDRERLIIELEKKVKEIENEVSYENNNIGICESRIIELNKEYNELVEVSETPQDAELINQKTFERFTKKAKERYQWDFLRLKEKEVQIKEKISDIQWTIRYSKGEKGELEIEQGKIDSKLKEANNQLIKKYNGVKKTILYEKTFSKDKKIMCKELDGELIEVGPNDFHPNNKEIDPKDYRGTLSHKVSIPCRYRITSPDPKTRDDIEKVMPYRQSEGNPLAEIEGRGFELDKRKKVEGDGLYFIFHIITHWNKGQFPSFVFNYCIPHIKYYTNEISILKNSISVFEDKIEELKTKLQTISTDLARGEKDCLDLSSELNTVENKKKNIHESIPSITVDLMIKENRAYLNNYIEDKKKSEKFKTEFNERMSLYKEELNKHKNKLKSLKQNHRDYLIHLQFSLNTIISLKEFYKDHLEDAGKTDPNLSRYEETNDFLKLFSLYQTKLEELTSPIGSAIPNPFRERQGMRQEEKKEEPEEKKEKKVPTNLRAPELMPYMFAKISSQPTGYREEKKEK